MRKKTMKRLMLLSITLLFIITPAVAQQRIVEKSFTVDGNQLLQLDLKFGETITVKAWDKNVVSFKANIEINRGKLNDALALDFDEQNGQLKISADYNHEMLKEGRLEDCPDRYSSYYLNSDVEGSYVICSEITYTLFVPANIKLNAETISGDIELIDLTGPIRAKSISGFVDLSWPDGKPADVNIKTISGEAFTDIEALELTNKKDHIPLVGYKINGKIGTGGPLVSLESISGNIYFRKGKG